MCKTLSLFKEYGVVNTTGYDIWMCDAGGETYLIKSRALARNLPSAIRVYVRVDGDALTRNFDRYGHEILREKSKGFPYREYTIATDDLLHHDTCYISEIAISFGFTKDAAIAAHEHTKLYAETHYNDILDIYRTAITLAPLKVVCNDPHHKLSQLWVVVNGKPLNVSISNKPHEPELCSVFIGSEPGNYDHFEFEIDKIINNQAIYSANQCTIALFQTRGLAQQYVDKTRQSDAVYTGVDLKDAVNRSNDSWKAKVDELEIAKSTLTQDNNILRAENKSLRESIAIRDVQQQKALEHENRMQLQEQAIAREQTKLQREETATRSAEISSWANVAKAAATIVPIVASVIGLYLSFRNNS